MFWSGTCSRANFICQFNIFMGTVLQCGFFILMEAFINMLLIHSCRDNYCTVAKKLLQLLPIICYRRGFMTIGSRIAYGDNTVAYTFFRNGFLIVGEKTIQHT